MTDNTKMREAMIDQDGAVWEKIGGAWSLYKPVQSVPVLGEPVAWVNFNKQGDVTRATKCRDSWCKTPVYSKPTTSIPTAEFERLRKDAERYRWLRDGNDNKKSAACHIAVNCYGLEWDDAIDAAIAQDKGE